MNKEAFINFKFPPIDADSFFHKDPEELESFFFKSDEKYQSLLANDTYFLVGTKGSGKTMYAAYMCRCDDTISADRYLVNFDDYKNMVDAMDKGLIRESDLKTIWKAILIVKILSCIDKNELEGFFGKSKIMETLQRLREMDVIRKIVCDGFYPVESAESQKMTSEYSAGASMTPLTASVSETKENSSTYNVKSVAFVDAWGQYIREVQECLKKVRLNKPVFLFVDGIDIRPGQLSYERYLNVVAALIRASFELNKEVLVTDKSYMKITVLSRPDILSQSGLPNLECVLHDNSVVLEWNDRSWTDGDQSFGMYGLVNLILSHIEENGEKKTEGSDVWAKNFGFSLKFRGEEKQIPSFEYCTIQSFCRPRNFVKLLTELQRAATEDSNNQLNLATYFNQDRLLNRFSSFSMQAIKSEMSFEYNQDEINLLIEFLKTFYKTFDFRDFKQNINHFSQKERLLSVFGDEMALLNLIYRLNIIGYFEPGQNSRAVRWHYREESISNLCPTLNSYRIDDDSRFKFHNSLEKELAVYIRKRHGTRENGNRQPRVWHFGDDDRNDTVLRR